MKTLFTSLSVPKKAGLGLVLLGIVGLFAGDPYRGTTYTIDEQELARVVETTVDHVSPQELADWIIQGKTDYRLIDLRTAKEFNEYHIPGAENVPVTSLADAGLGKLEKIVLYSEGGIHSAQAWFLLRAKGHRAAYMLFGGLEEWKDRVLFPKMAANASPAETVEFAKMSAVSRYFGGAPQSTGADTAAAPAIAMPKMEMPSAPSAGTQGGGAPKKKKKEGC
jgi:rhodanese-related sulfurtransferase